MAGAFAIELACLMPLAPGQLDFQKGFKVMKEYARESKKNLCCDIVNIRKRKGVLRKCLWTKAHKVWHFGGDVHSRAKL